MEKQNIKSNSVISVIPAISVALQKWYAQNQRVLPWRASKDPYAIWISETMLQQTTTQAVRPFFERFLKRFPTLQSLAKAKQEEVVEAWAGLGYYSRARNLHAAAITLAKEGIPKDFASWLKLPGVGPYTSRAVSSLAFGEEVGVLDGNVIRVLSRIFALKLEWWKTKERNQLQSISDQLVKFGDPSVVNQSLMELGALVCTPKSPSCMSCPVSKQCLALKNDLVADLPLRKKPAERTILHWSPFVVEDGGRLALVQNTYAPFLKGQWLYPGQCEKKQTKPKNYRFVHYITQYDIYVSPKELEPQSIKALTSVKWISADKIKSVNPSSLLQKVIIAIGANKTEKEVEVYG